jgi:hypothetical protein
MRLFQDIKSRWLLHAKGLLFLFLGLMAGGLILTESPDLRTFVLLLVSVWGFCRFYYYLFYVLEKYAGRERKYAGIVDALGYLLRKR